MGIELPHEHRKRIVVNVEVKICIRMNFAIKDVDALERARQRYQQSGLASTPDQLDEVGIDLTIAPA